MQPETFELISRELVGQQLAQVRYLWFAEEEPEWVYGEVERSLWGLDLVMSSQACFGVIALGWDAMEIRRESVGIRESQAQVWDVSQREHWAGLIGKTITHVSMKVNEMITDEKQSELERAYRAQHPWRQQYDRLRQLYWRLLRRRRQLVLKVDYDSLKDTEKVRFVDGMDILFDNNVSVRLSQTPTEVWVHFGIPTALRA